jgi:hypothetical protein
MYQPVFATLRGHVWFMARLSLGNSLQYRGEKKGLVGYPAYAQSARDFSQLAMENRRPTRRRALQNLPALQILAKPNNLGILRCAWLVLRQPNLRNL